jgi:uncharacterized membrane protein YeaQ/YmgE (transglycosylase-associated protein family)
MPGGLNCGGLIPKIGSLYPCERAEREGKVRAMDISLGGIVVFAIAGLIIGAIARLILPGKQSMGWVLTMVIGVVAAILGGLIWNAIFSGNEGIAWIGSIIVAILLIVGYERIVAKRT